MFQLELMGGKKFNISQEEANSLIGQNGLVAIPSLGGMINISSIASILPVEVSNTDRKKTNDGTWCIRKFGQWYLENNPETRVNLSYYPELEEIKDKAKELPSSFAKEIANKF
jgi:hypothetical protein